MFIPVLLFVLALLACSAFAAVVSLLGSRRHSRVVASAMLGYVSGGAAVWLLVPSEWPLSFAQTLAASVDARTWGHPVEHYAESLLVVMLGACVLGAVVFSIIATFGGRLVRRFVRPHGASATNAAIGLLTVTLLVPAPHPGAEASTFSASVAAPQESAEPEPPTRSAPTRLPGQDGLESFPIADPGADRVLWPKVLRSVEPEYTAAAKERKIEGIVGLTVVVETDGTVGRIRMTRSLDAVYGLDDAAVRAASQWLFEPATKDGAPVPVRVEMELAFRLAQAPRPGPTEWELPATIRVTRDVDLMPRQDPTKGMQRGVLYGGPEDRSADFSGITITKDETFQMIHIDQEGACRIRYESRDYRLSSCPWLDGFRDHQEDIFVVDAGKK